MQKIRVTSECNNTNKSKKYETISLQKTKKNFNAIKFDDVSASCQHEIALFAVFWVRDKHNGSATKICYKHLHIIK